MLVASCEPRLLTPMMARTIFSLADFARKGRSDARARPAAVEAARNVRRFMWQWFVVAEFARIRTNLEWAGLLQTGYGLIVVGRFLFGALDDVGDRYGFAAGVFAGVGGFH